MVSASISVDEFDCACCDRRLPAGRRASAFLENSLGQRKPLCTSCAGFLKSGLGFLVGRVESRLLKLKDGPESIESFPSPRPEPVRNKTGRIEPPPKRRFASLVERDAFVHHSLSIERFIEGFIRGMETGGMRRYRLSGSAEAAINRLLGIRQTLMTERLNAGNASRADIRRLRRHLVETDLLTEEYVQAVAESLERSGDVDPN